LIEQKDNSKYGAATGFLCVGPFRCDCLAIFHVALLDTPPVLLLVMASVHRLWVFGVDFLPLAHDSNRAGVFARQLLLRQVQVDRCQAKFVITISSFVNGLLIIPVATSPDVFKVVEIHHHHVCFGRSRLLAFVQHRRQLGLSVGLVPRITFVGSLRQIDRPRLL